MLVRELDTNLATQCPRIGTGKIYAILRHTRNCCALRHPACGQKQNGSGETRFWRGSPR